MVIRRRHIGGRFWREVLLGPAYWWHQALISKSKAWTAAEQRAYQERRIRRTFARYDRSVVRTKADYTRNASSYNWLCIPGLTKVMRTGGTSATPFAFYMDTFARRQKERAYLFDIWAAVGYRPFDLRVVYRGNIGSRLISYDWLENCYIISPSKLMLSNSYSVSRFLKTLPPFFLHVYPSSLFTLIDILGESSFKALPVRGVLAGSELFPRAQMDAFERKYGLRVAHWYGHAEYASIARHCRSCNGFHFYPTYGFTEIVPDKVGDYRIVVTSFNHCGTRFARYDTGDLARPAKGFCPEPYFRVDAIEGREQEYFLDREGQRRAFGPYLFGIHDEFWDRISSIQFVQGEPGRLDVKLVVKDASDVARLEDYLRRRFAVCELQFHYVDRVPTTAVGKRRYYVSALH